MIRKFAVVAAATAMLCASAGAAFAATPVNATGTATCNISGSVKIKPGLSATPAVQTVTFKLTLTGCTGTSGVASGKATGAIVNPAPATLTSLAGLGTHPVTAAIKWKGAGKYNASSITISNDFGSATAFDAPATNADSPGHAGTSAITGSFVGEHAHTHALISSIKGLDKGVVKGITFGGGTMQINTTP